jgi:hypothetical protein
VTLRFATLLLACTASAGSAAFAADATPAPAAACDIVSAGEVAAIVGLSLQPPDQTSRSAGICFFAGTSIDDQGSASYALVTAEALAQRRPYFAVLARRCAGVAPAAPRAALCATYAKIADANDLEEYFTARTGTAAEPVADLGDGALATDDAVYVLRGPYVVEATVTIAQAFDLPRTTALVKLLLARLKP